MRVAVAPAVLAEAIGGIRRTADGLVGALAGVEHAVAPVTGSWTGAAAVAFGRKHAQWQQAAAGLLATLSELASAADTAHGNYVSAATANSSIWASARGTDGIELETDDARAAVAALTRVADALTDAWTGLSTALDGSGAMAGADADGAAFAADHDTMAAAVWRGWRTAVVMLDAITGGLITTTNNVIRAEHRSNPRPTSPDADVVTTAPAAVPQPALPPAAAGERSPLTWQMWAPIVSSYWPRASPDALHDARRPWLAAAEPVLDAAGRATATIDELAATNADPALQDMRAFSHAVLSPDPAGGLFGVLAVANRRMAGVCSMLADVTDATRARMRAEIERVMGGGEWYHRIADLTDPLTRGASGVVAEVGDLMMLDLYLSGIHAEHAQQVALVRQEISPAAVDQLARFATALEPPKLVNAYTTPVGTLSAQPRPETDRAALIAELESKGTKISPAAVVSIARLPDGRIVWLERGNETAGLAHILRTGRIRDFMARGVAAVDVPQIAMRAVTQGTPLGRVGEDGVAYDVDIGGGRRSAIVVLVGDNGFIVTARPLGTKDKIT